MGFWSFITKLLGPIFKYGSGLAFSAFTGIIAWIKNIGIFKCISYISIFSFMSTSLYNFLFTGNILPVVYDFGTKLITAEHNISQYLIDFTEVTTFFDKSMILLSIIGSYIIFIYTINILTKLQSFFASNTSYGGLSPILMSLVILALIEIAILVPVSIYNNESINPLENPEIVPFSGFFAPLKYLGKSDVKFEGINMNNYDLNNINDDSNDNDTVNTGLICLLTPLC